MTVIPSGRRGRILALAVLAAVILAALVLARSPSGPAEPSGPSGQPGQPGQSRQSQSGPSQPGPSQPGPSQPGGVAPAGAGLPVGAAPDTGTWVAAPGRVEPVSEEIKLSFDMSGRIRGVSVEEGDRIQAGQVVAELDNDDFRARVALAEAVLANRRAELDKTLAGARRQERREAGSRASEAEADMVQAKREFERRERLKDMAVISREEADRSEREMLMAASRAEALRQRHSLVEDRAREEDIAMARAAVAEAAARLDEARALFEKTVIRSPMAATVLRKHRREGEIVSSAFDTPILTIGDVSRLRVRAEVDEADIARIRGGQRAYVVAEAFGPEKFWGSVGRVSRILGRKNVRTDRPDERVDTKVLETLIDMDTADRLVSGLRVDVYVIVEPGG